MNKSVLPSSGGRECVFAPDKEKSGPVSDSRVIALTVISEQVNGANSCSDDDFPLESLVASDIKAAFLDALSLPLGVLKRKGRRHVSRLLCVLAGIMAVFFCLPFNAAALSVSAASAVLMVADSGEIIFEKDAYSARSMASTTKIMTALLAIEQCTPDRIVDITEEMTSVEGTSMGLKPGDRVTLRSLVYGMLLQSGNDAANAVALTLSDSIEGFADMMNKRADELGMTGTNFVTPSGLDADDHYTTAYDMALLGCAAIRNPEFLAVCSDESERVSFVEPETSVTFSNHNRLLYSYDGTVGIKTGFTKKSGRCLVSAAIRNGVTLVAVTLNDGNDWNDHMNMFDYGFAAIKTETLDTRKKLSLKIVGGKKSSIGVTPGGNNMICYTGEFPTDLTSEVLIKQFEYAPVSAGDLVGEVRFYRGDKLVAVAELIADEGVEALTEPITTEIEQPWYRKLLNRFTGNK